MRIFLIILFMAVFVGNNFICDWYYPLSDNIESEWYKWDAMKKQINEVIFLIALLIPLFKKDLISTILIMISAMVVSGSVIDKLNNVNKYHLHDIVLVVGSFFIGREIYKYIKKKGYV